jgi:hypothetical protein
MDIVTIVASSRLPLRLLVTIESEIVLIECHLHLQLHVLEDINMYISRNCDFSSLTKVLQNPCFSSIYVNLYTTGKLKLVDVVCLK